MTRMANFNAREVENAWNTHSVDKVLELYAENAEVTTPEAQEPLRGKSAIRENVQGWMKSFPDLNCHVDKSVVSGQEVAVLAFFTGTNRGEIALGPGNTIPATNKKVDMPVTIFATLDSNGKIVKERDVFDTGAYFQQLGISPEQMASATGSPSSSRATTPTRSR